GSTPQPARFGGPAGQPQRPWPHPPNNRSSQPAPPDVCDHSAMRSRIHAVVLPSEVGEFADDVRQVFVELGRSFGLESLAGECSPPIDVFETDSTVEIAVDLPGTDPTAFRILVRG